eukprot:TRINITY_DN3587_c0_g1_i1.p1 TRINITY_DN3587_c0_g1~~TRINITY_DN3587_c0_g1_i1.p1  ORF type:complete len:365 (+),score=116.21 TRINITY_DN3587_c0_g1_i1:78-1172(+)
MYAPCTLQSMSYWKDERFRVLSRDIERGCATAALENPDDHAAELIARSISTCNAALKFISFRSINSNPLKSSVLATICEAIEKNPTVESFCAQDCKISTDGVNSISKMIASGCVEHLDLSENVISTEGLGFLCKAIKCNHSLKSLELRNCSITEIGARMLSEAIKSGTSLSFLDLSNNKIGDMGIYFLSEGICSSPFFNQLSVKSCGISSSGCKSIKKILGEPRIPLETLNISENIIGDQGVATFARELFSSKFIKRIVLDGCGLTDEGRSILSQVLVGKSSDHFEIVEKSFNRWYKHWSDHNLHQWQKQSLILCAAQIAEPKQSKHFHLDFRSLATSENMSQLSELLFPETSHESKKNGCKLA